MSSVAQGTQIKSSEEMQQCSSITSRKLGTGHTIVGFYLNDNFFVIAANRFAYLVVDGRPVPEQKTFISDLL